MSDIFERWWARVRGKPDPLLRIGQEDVAFAEVEKFIAEEYFRSHG